MTIHDLTAEQPHITLPVGAEVYVIPVALVRDWIAGRDWPEPDIIKQIMREWLDSMEASP